MSNNNGKYSNFICRFFFGCRCFIPGYDKGKSFIPLMNESWIRNTSLPPNKDGDGYSQCERYDVNVASLFQPGNMSTIPCSEWVFDETIIKSSITTQVL